MKKVFFALIVIGCIYLVGCDVISLISPQTHTEASTEIITELHIEAPTESITQTPTEAATESETISYDQRIAELDSEYASRRQPIDENYNTDLSAWEIQHSSLEDDLSMLELEYSYTNKSYNSQISYLETEARQNARKAAQEAYDRTYSKYSASAGGFGSSAAKPAAQQAYNTAYDNVMDSYESEMASLEREKYLELEKIQAKINLQKQKINNSEDRKELLDTTYNDSIASLDSWYESEKQAIDIAYGK